MSRVTVALPVYNGERHVAHALETLLAQDYDDFELHIWDNASTDGTRAICEAAVARDRRVRYHRHAENRGAIFNFNNAFRSSTSELFAWAGHDDEWQPTFLSRLVAALDAHPQAILAHPWVRFIDLDGRPRREKADDFLDENTGRSERFRVVVQTWFGMTCIYGLMRASALRCTHLLQQLQGSDTVLVSELALLGPFVQVREPLWTYRTAGFDQGEEYRIKTREGLKLDDFFTRRALYLRLCLAYLSVVAHSDVPADEKLILTGHVLRWYPFEALILPTGHKLLATLVGEERVAALLASLHRQPWYRRFRRIDECGLPE